jgi:hypothetical protein
MIYGIARALFMLAVALVKSLFWRVAGRDNGLRLFQANYRDDRLPPVTADEREAFPAFSGCIACGLCDVGEGTRRAASRGAYPGLMQLVLASSRSMPDHDAAARGFAHVPDEVLAAKELICPGNVPFRRLAQFVRSNAGVKPFVSVVPPRLP